MDNTTPWSVAVLFEANTNNKQIVIPCVQQSQLVVFLCLSVCQSIFRAIYFMAHTHGNYNVYLCILAHMLDNG